MLSDSQFGYRPHRSTELASTLFLDNIRKNMDKGQLTGAIFIDLRKAFDTISHSLIVSKLPNYGISGIEKEWFTNYLFAREQCVSVNGEQSSFKPVKCGVPQGSILGPLLFIIHFNGIVASLNNCKILMYADDTVIYYSHKDIEVIEKKLQDDLASITSWLQQNQLIINMKKGKTESMLFGTGKRLSTLNGRQMNLECNASKVNFTSHYKYLGVHLKSSLNMNDHVNKAFKKASGYLKLLAKTRSFLSTKASLEIYRAMVIPVLTYCSLVWTCSTTTQKKRLESFEKRAARIIFGTSEEQASNRMPSRAIERIDDRQIQNDLGILVSELQSLCNSYDAFWIRNENLANPLSFTCPFRRNCSKRKKTIQSAAECFDQLTWDTPQLMVSSCCGNWSELPNYVYITTTPRVPLTSQQHKWATKHVY
ncbi:Hypothetical predicted protein [Paramuricea clavata]|uniref:Uncharacterized protein n=1 Tax=Paramuricea clavata TaxID=317549 RepID=A0A6S7JJK9_PARCT|nr:Hypothetical predicted protein [Paramuricea clavata]